MKTIWSGNKIRIIWHRGAAHYTYHYEGKKVGPRKIPGDTQTEWIMYARRLEKELGFVTDDTVAIDFKEAADLYLSQCDLMVQKAAAKNRGERVRGKSMGYGRQKEINGHIKNHLSSMDLPTGLLMKTKLDKFTAQTGYQIRTRLEMTCTPQTANKVMNTVSLIIQNAIAEGLIENNPMRDVQSIAGGEERDDYTPTQDELVRVVDCASDRYKPIILFAAMSGLRVSEIIPLEWSDIEGSILSIKRAWRNGRMKDTKTKHGFRRIKLSEQAMIVLRNHQQISGHPVYVFPNTKGKLDSADNWRNRGLYPACDRAGVRRFGWHGLRRFYINSLLDTDAQLEKVQKLAGHAQGSPVTMKHYRKVRDDAVLVDELTVSVGHSLKQPTPPVTPKSKARNV